MNPFNFLLFSMLRSCISRWYSAQFYPCGYPRFITLNENSLFCLPMDIRMTAFSESLTFWVIFTSSSLRLRLRSLYSRLTVVQ